MKKSRFGYVVVRVALIAQMASMALTGCGKEEGEGKRDDDSKQDDSSERDDAASEQDGGGDRGDAGVDVETDPWCGDGTIQDPEECDDGNHNDDDGCNGLCTYSCKDDSECDDLDPCNGEESCDTKKHVCRSAGIAEDGVSCGDAKSCLRGICRKGACGDGKKNGGEECDYNDPDDANGCTAKCRYICVAGDKTRNCKVTDPCAAPQECRDLDHMCHPVGKDADDKTDCPYGKEKEGWCIKGRCVIKGCGDAVVEGEEECDSGKDAEGNRVKCSIDCRKIVCGNERLDPGEQCDDGNTVNLDGCDSSCKAEIVFRLTNVDLIRGTPPVGCVYRDNRNAGKGNAFGNAIAEEVVIAGQSIEINELINEAMSTGIAEGANSAIIQALDFDVLTMSVPDDAIRLGIYAGVPAEEPTEEPPGVDFPFLLDPFAVTDDNLPAFAIDAKLEPGGLIVTAEPADVEVQIPLGLFKVYNMVTRTTVNLESASPISPPPEVIDELLVPEYMGDDPEMKSVVCGAIAADSLARIPLREEGDAETRVNFGLGLDQCCWDPAVRDEPYRTCKEGDEHYGPDKNCDSFLDVMRGGCDIYMAGCGKGGPHRVLIYPTEPDVDYDEDGENDAYSGVLGIKGMRAKITGISPQTEMPDSLP